MEKMSISCELLEKIIDYFYDDFTDDGIPIIAEIKDDLLKEFPDEFEEIGEVIE